MRIKANQRRTPWHHDPNPSSATSGKQASDTNAIRPFSFKVPEADLVDLRRRVAATKWPDRETVNDASEGVQLATIQKLARYWATDYDWRKVEAKLNALPQFITEIDGLDIHFIHVRSKHENALPLIVTHGWPGSIIEQMKIIDPLTNPTAHGGSAADAFDVVIPSMPGYGFSGKPTTHRLGPDPHRPRLDRADEASRLHAICRAGRRLGRIRHGADGRAGAAGIARHPHQHAVRRAGRNLRRRSRSHTPPAGLSADEKRAFEQLDFFFTHGLSYAQQMANHPQTLYGIADSPVGLAAWFLDHDMLSYELIARVFDGQQRRPHARRRARQHHAHLADEHGDLRVASLSGEQAALLRPDGRQDPDRVSAFPDELYQVPESWAKRAYPKLIHYNKLAKGGHFAAWEQPKLLTEEIRAGFRSLRKSM